jgi:hypothetical protein
LKTVPELLSEQPGNDHNIIAESTVNILTVLLSVLKTDIPIFKLSNYIIFRLTILLNTISDVSQFMQARSPLRHFPFP